MWTQPCIDDHAINKYLVNCLVIQVNFLDGRNRGISWGLGGDAVVELVGFVGVKVMVTYTLTKRGANLYTENRDGVCDVEFSAT